MNIIFRCLLTVYAFCLTICSLFSMIVTLRPEQTFNRVVRVFREKLLFQGNHTVLLFIIELFFFCLSIMFLLSGFKSDKEKRIISKVNEFGEVKISLNTIESIVLGTVRKIQMVKDTRVFVEKRNEKLHIMIRVVAISDANIPAISKEIQDKAKKSVENNTGLQVQEVQVLVEDVYNIYRSRVE